MKNKKLLGLIVSSVVLLNLTGCSDTIYGIPKSEWNTLTPREQQQLAASQSVGHSQKPAILKIFDKPQLTPEQQAQADIEAGNSASPGGSVGAPPAESGSFSH